MRPANAITTVRGTPIQMQDVVAHLKLKGHFRQAVYEVIERHVIEHEAELRRLKADKAMIEQAVARQRQQAGLRTDQQFVQYLRFLGATEEQWWEAARLEVLRHLLRETVIDDAEITRLYQANAQRYVSVSLARIITRNRQSAFDIVEAVNNGEDFGSLVRTHSTDENTRHASGFLGLFKPGMLPPWIETVIFNSPVDSIAGPFQEEKMWTVYKILSVNRENLDQRLAGKIRQAAFDEWLRKQVHLAPT